MANGLSEFPTISAIRLPRSVWKASGAADCHSRVARSSHEKGDRPKPIPSYPERSRSLFQVVGQVLVHFEHADPVLAPKNFLECRVCHNFPFVLRVLQVVLANVVPHLRHDLTAR